MKAQALSTCDVASEDLRSCTEGETKMVGILPTVLTTTATNGKQEVVTTAVKVTTLRQDIRAFRHCDGDSAISPLREPFQKQCVSRVNNRSSLH